MSHEKHTSPESFTNSTCRHLGHEWMTTAAADYRVCTRERCRASQRLVNGAWISNAPFYRRHQPVVPTGRKPRQTTMWDTDRSPRHERM